ncbi:peroxide stress protein YaaA [Paludibacteraceae bacterium OttesenSCG-928-F17]|nr:peroxide stress protein YaaA [Paludibacteraceae bacterium OttesenSCG-928-F17]
MLLILSPAKIQDFKPNSLTVEYTVPYYMKEADYLVENLRKYSKEQLTELLEVNNDIAKSAYDKFYNWSEKHTPENSKQALFVYAGEVYRGLQAGTFTEKDIAFAQQHLRVFSGLYGVLRPLDLIQPYRFEMNAKLKNNAGKDMYAFWTEKLTEATNIALEESGEPQVLLNLCSNEYFKALDKKKLKAPVIHFEFLDHKNGIYKPITIYMKKARGMMARYIIKNQINSVEDLKGFDSEGYWFNTALSTEDKLVFTRG